MRRVVTSSVIALLIIGLLGVGFYYFKKYRNAGENAINAIPADASFFIDFYNDAGNLKKIVNSIYAADNKNDPDLGRFIGSFFKMDSILQANTSIRELFGTGHLIISAHVTRATDYDFLFLISLPAGYGSSECEQWVREIAGDPHTALQARNYDGITVNELLLSGGRSFTFTVSKGVFAGSFTSFLVEDAIRQQKLKKPFGGDKSFIELYRRESLHREDKIYFRYNNLSAWLGMFADPARERPFSGLSNFGGWSCLSLQAEKDHLLFAGLTTTADSGSYLNLFSRQSPVKMELPGILPGRTAAFLYYGLSNQQQYFADLKRYLSQMESGAEKERYLNTLEAAYDISVRDKLQRWLGNEYALMVTEPGGTNFTNNVMAVFKARDTLLAMQELRELGQRVAGRQGVRWTVENYNGHTIGLINLKNVMASLYGDIFNKLNRLFFTNTGNYIVFSNQASGLRSFIDDFQAGRTLQGSNRELNPEQITRNGNFCFYSRIPACSYLFKSVASADAGAWVDHYKGLSRWNAFAFMIQHTPGGFQTSAGLLYTQMPATGVNLVWSAELDSGVIAGPSFVSMGQGQQGVLVQDATLRLWLLDNAGLARWKIQLDEPVISDFHTLDVVKNGQVQFLFNTPTRLLMIDTAGKYFSGFPIRLPSTATNGVSVFDFDNEKEYRIYVACSNGRIYGYQASGKPLLGWNFAAVTAGVTDPVAHFNLDKNDILLFNDAAGKVYLLDKFGQEIRPIHQLLFKNKTVPFYLDSDREGNYSFVTLDTAGNLCSIMPDGFIRVHPLMEFADGAGFAMTDLNLDDENDFLLNDGTQISLYQQDSLSLFSRIPGGEADPGILIFPGNGKETRIGVWSSVNGHAYLFNSNGSLYKGFPIKADRAFKLDEMNNDGRKNILVSHGREVYLYLLE